MTFALVQYEDLLSRRWWYVPPSGNGRWVLDRRKATRYSTERSAHVAWTAVSRHYNHVKCVPYPRNKEAVASQNA